MQTETYPGPTNPQGAGSTPAERIELRRFDSNVYLATSVHTRSGCGLSVCLAGRLCAVLNHKPGECMMTGPTTACSDGLAGVKAEEKVPLGKHLRYFGDGF